MLHHGDCLEVLKTLPDASVDSLVTDPPAGISFMGKDWDGDKGGRAQWVAWMTEVMRECYRVLKPGAHGLVWALPRTSHWTATALEDAGFEVRDVVTHLFGTGFPKSLDVSKAESPACLASMRAFSGSTLIQDLAPIVEQWASTGIIPTTISLSKLFGSVLPVTGASTKKESHGTQESSAYAQTRFLYCPKASKSDKGADNSHPTVKSTALMRYLIRLVTPPSGTVLDPFAGSGSTLVAAKSEGMSYLGIERDESYHAIAAKRLG